VTTAHQPDKPRNRDLDDEKKRQALLKGGRAFLKRIKGWGREEVRPADLLDAADLSLGDAEELDDAALLKS
jgi:hypothetical protein